MGKGKEGGGRNEQHIPDAGHVLRLAEEHEERVVRGQAASKIGFLARPLARPRPLSLPDHAAPEQPDLLLVRPGTRFGKTALRGMERKEEEKKAHTCI